MDLHDKYTAATAYYNTSITTTSRVYHGIFYDNTRQQGSTIKIGLNNTFKKSK